MRPRVLGPDEHPPHAGFVGASQDGCVRHFNTVDRMNSTSFPATIKPDSQPTSADHPRASTEKPAVALESPPRRSKGRYASERDIDLAIEKSWREDEEMRERERREGPVPRDNLVSSDTSRPSPPNSSTHPRLIPSEDGSERKMSPRRGSDLPISHPLRQLEDEEEEDDDPDDDSYDDDYNEEEEEEEGNDYDPFDGLTHPGSWAPPPNQQAFQRNLPQKPQNDDGKAQSDADSDNSARATSPEDKLLDDPRELSPAQLFKGEITRRANIAIAKMKKGVRDGFPQPKSSSGAAKVERAPDTPTEAASKPPSVNDQVPQTLKTFTSELHQLEFGRALKIQFDSAGITQRALEMLLMEAEPVSPTAADQRSRRHVKHILEELWNQHRQEITTLCQTMTIEQAMLHMRDRHGFSATYDSFLFLYTPPPPPDFEFCPHSVLNRCPL